MVLGDNKVIFAITLLLVTVFGGGPDDEPPPNYEYIQIFKSIPTLFEYLLDVLEERPEILEKNEVTLFKRHSDTADYERGMNVGFKRDIRKKESIINEMINDSDSTEIQYSTIIHEYGRSHHDLKIHNSSEITDHISKREIVSENQTTNQNSSTEFNKFENTKNIRNKNAENFNSITKSMKEKSVENKANGINKLEPRYAEKETGSENLKRSTALKSFGRSFLTSEEIEEQMIKVEQILEEHNSNKKTNVD